MWWQHDRLALHDASVILGAPRRGQLRVGDHVEAPERILRANIPHLPMRGVKADLGAASIVYADRDGRVFVKRSDECGHLYDIVADGHICLSYRLSMGLSKSNAAGEILGGGNSPLQSPRS